MRSPAGPTGYSSPGRTIVPGPPNWPVMSTPPTVSSVPFTPLPLPGGSGGVTLAERPPFRAESGSGTGVTGSGTAIGESKSPASPAVPEKHWPWGTSLVVALVALACSASWNVYLLVLLKEARRRYQNLLQRSGLTQDELDEEAEAGQEENRKDTNQPYRG